MAVMAGVEFAIGNDYGYESHKHLTASSSVPKKVTGKSVLGNRIATDHNARANVIQTQRKRKASKIKFEN